MYILGLMNFGVALAELNYHLISEAFVDLSSRILFSCFSLFLGQ